ncbi:MAG: ABC transporter permease subunit [Clostridiales bacterium]|nr:ABC transporter permease subunit [Clostridiales bacterium]
MMLDITLMEIKRLKKTLITGLLAPAFYSLLIMVFYTAFAGAMTELGGILDNASLQNLLKAFSMDTNTFSYILNYYVAYNGVYMLIMGIVFASILSVHLFSKELKDGTYEFIYSNPIRRLKIFVSKAAVIVIYLLVLNIMVFFVGLISIEALKTKSPIFPWLSDENIEMVVNKVDKNPEGLKEAFILDETIFYDVMYSGLNSQFSEISSVSSIDEAVVTDLLTVFLLDPDNIFDELLSDPKYMALFNLENEEIFKTIIENQKDNYFNMKNHFSSDMTVAVSMFKSSPEVFLKQLKTSDQINNFGEVFNINSKELDNLYIYYSFTNYLKLSITVFWVMLSIAFFIMMITIIIPKGRATTGVVTGIAMLIYIINMIGNITEKAKVVKYFSPLSYVNMDVMAIKYHTEQWSIVVMILIIAISVVVSAIAFEKSDLIA